jgi:transcriptional regulator with XRE-family HTH domain
MAETTFLSTLGMRIRELRKQRNLSQNELALQCNFEKASLSRIECGKTNVTILTLKKISEALQADMSEFFENGVENKQSSEDRVQRI